MLQAVSGEASLTVAGRGHAIARCHPGSMPGGLGLGGMFISHASGKSARDLSDVSVMAQA